MPNGNTWTFTTWTNNFILNKCAASFFTCCATRKVFIVYIQTILLHENTCLGSNSWIPELNKVRLSIAYVHCVSPLWIMSKISRILSDFDFFCACFEKMVLNFLFSVICTSCSWSYAQRFKNLPVISSEYFELLLYFSLIQFDSILNS